MLKWNQIKDSGQYVLELLQRPDGVRRISVRELGEPRHQYAVLETEPHLGADLRRWNREAVLCEHVRLRDGSHFIEETHGGWMTEAEFAYWRLPPNVKAAVPKAEVPWVNGLPPRLPEK